MSIRSSVVVAVLLAAGPSLLGAQNTPAGSREGARAVSGLPLAASRTVTFTTNRGSWMSLDVSPDGRTIVFDLLGDLYIMPIGGGKATRLTSGLAFDSQPRFSPDGTRVVFVSDRGGAENLWIQSLDGRDTLQLTKGDTFIYLSPVWTPDGHYVVAGKARERLGGPAKLWIYHLDGGTGAPLVDQPAPLKVTGPAMSPDGRMIWYASRMGDWEYDAIFPMYQLSVYDRRTGVSTAMSSRYGSAFRPGISPDGKWLVYGTRYETETGLRLRDLGTGDERWLAYPVQRDDQEASRGTMDLLPGFAFTPDSKAIVVSYGGRIWRVPLDGGAAVEIPFTAEVAVELGPEVRFRYPIDDTPTFTAHQIRDVAPSPDGRRLAFTAMDRLYLMDLPDGTPRRVTMLEIGEFMPTWSPDGRSIAFVSWDDAAGGGHVHRVQADGRSAPIQLTRTAAFYTQPAWAPDGWRIAVLRAPARDLRDAHRGFYGYGRGAELAWVPVQGGDAVAISLAGTSAFPHFTRDTTRVFVYSRVDGLVSMRWDGTDPKPIVKVVGPASGPSALLVKMAPAGDQAFALMGTDLYAVTVPVAGGAAPTIVADPGNAAFPVRKLTDIGAQFPAWGPDGRMVHWAVGNAHIAYDLARAAALEDSLKRLARSVGSEQRDGQGRSADGGRYRPVERRIAIQVRRDIPRGEVVLRGGRVVTMKGKEIIDDADILIRDNRIVSVARRGFAGAPANARVIDVRGTTIVPGFVDIHYHPQQLVPNIHKGQPWQYLAQLAYGVTTTRDPQSSTTDVLTYQDQVEAGDALGPRIYSTGPSIDYTAFRSFDEVRDAVRRYARYYETKTLKMYLTGNRRIRQWVVMAAKEFGLMPTTEGGLDVKLGLTHVLDGYAGLEHALPVTPLFRDVAELFTRSGITYTPTLIVSYGGPFGENYWYTNTDVHGDPKLRHFTPESELDARTRRRGGRTIASGGGPGGWFRSDEYVFAKHAAFAKDVIEAGGRIAIGSHGQLHGLGYHWEMWMMQSGGMSNHDVLRTATILGAEGIGLERDLGSLEPGKLADLVVLEGNPLEDIKHTNTVRYVMKNGRLYEGATLDQIHPDRKPLPAYPWQDEAPKTNAGIR